MSLNPSSSPAEQDHEEHPVELTGGSVVLQGRPILRRVDLTVRAGEFVTVMGANGSGKSTLIRAVTGLLPLAHGDLRLFGTPAATFTDRHRIGLVPQQGTVLGGVPSSVREVVTSGLIGRRRVLRPLSRAQREVVRKALAAVDLTGKAHEAITHLSGGQRQRMLIARALAGQPDLLVLDEPNAGVDLPHQEAIAAVLALLKEQGVTMLMVAHELGPVASLVDRAVVMRDGRVVYDGPPLSQEQVHAHHDHPVLHVPSGPLSPLTASPFETIEEGR